MFRGLQRQALRRGILGGSGLWTTVWVLTVGIKLLRRLRSPRPEILLSQKLQPGEGFVIKGLKPEATKSRRRK